MTIAGWSAALDLDEVVAVWDLEDAGTDPTVTEVVLDPGWVLVKGVALTALEAADLLPAVTDLAAVEELDAEVVLDPGWLLAKGVTLQALTTAGLGAAVTDLTTVEVVLDTEWVPDRGVTLRSTATVLADAAVDFCWPAVVTLVEVDAVLDLEDAPMDVGVPLLTLDTWLMTTLLPLLGVALVDAVVDPDDALLALDGCLAVVTLEVAATLTNLKAALPDSIETGVSLASLVAVEHLEGLHLEDGGVTGSFAGHLVTVTLRKIGTGKKG